jgi:hypothetical protein
LKEAAFKHLDFGIWIWVNGVGKKEDGDARTLSLLPMGD